MHTYIAEMAMDTMSSPQQFKSPDRDEIYHIRMPEGRTARTRNMLERNEELRSQGLIKRGTTGVRMAGRDVVRVGANGAPVMIHDVTSSSAPVRGAVGGMVADAISMKTTVVGEEGRERAGQGSSGHRSAVQRQSTNFVIRLDTAGARQANPRPAAMDMMMMDETGSLAEEDIDAIVRGQGQLQQRHVSSAAKPLSSRFGITGSGNKGRVAVVERVGRQKGGVASRLSTNQLQQILLQRQLASGGGRGQRGELFGVETVPLARRAPVRAKVVGLVEERPSGGRIVVGRAVSTVSSGRVAKPLRAKPVVSRTSILSRIQVEGRPLGGSRTIGGGGGRGGIANRISLTGQGGRNF